MIAGVHVQAVVHWDIQVHDCFGRVAATLFSNAAALASECTFFISGFSRNSSPQLSCSRLPMDPTSLPVCRAACMLLTGSKKWQNTTADFAHGQVLWLCMQRVTANHIRLQQQAMVWLVISGVQSSAAVHECNTISDGIHM